MNSSVLGIGTSLPPFSVTQEEAVALVQTFDPSDSKDGRLLSALYRRTQVCRRTSVLLEASKGSPRQSFFGPTHKGNNRGPTTLARMERYAKDAPALAFKASQQALRASGLKTRRITHIITVSCTGFLAPGLDTQLIHKLGLSSLTQRTHVGFMGCHGALNGLRLAKAIVDADSDARVLLCAVELCSLHFQYGRDPEKVVANALFADGAAAMIIGPPPKKSADTWQVQATGSGVFPDSQEAMTWKIGDHGFEMTLSPRIPGLIGMNLPAWCKDWLGKNKLKISDIRSWAVHPGGPRILDSVSKCLEMSPGMTRASREALAAYGNMSSPTVLFILQDLMLQKAPKPCVALAFGPGLSVEAALFT